MSLRKASRRRPPTETPADAPADASAPPEAAAPPAVDYAPARDVPALAAAGPAAMLALLQALGPRRQAALAASAVAMLVAGALVGHAASSGPVPARPDPAVTELAASVAALRADLAQVRTRVETTAAAGDVQALERRIVSMRESVERARTELTAAASLPTGAMEQLRQQQAASAVQVATQLGRVEDTVKELGQRLEAAERQAAAPQVTGSLAATRPSEAIATPASPAPAEGGTTVQAKAADTRNEGRTAAQQSERTPDRPDKPVLNGWYVHEVRRGVALVEGPSGGLFEVAKGQTLPGVGKIETIERRGRGWALLTNRGSVEPAPW